MDDDYAINGFSAQDEELFKPSKFGSRPSGKSIYMQRKQYAQSLYNSEKNFQHRAEHLVTCDLGNELKNVDDCLKHLNLLHAEGKVWGQELILQIQNGELLLTDLESRDSLESIPMENIERCQSLHWLPPYSSILAVSVRNQTNASVLLFQCDEQPASIVHKNLEKALTQWKRNQQDNDNIRNKLQNDVSERGQFPNPGGPMESPVFSHSNIETPQESPVSERRFEPQPLSFQPPSDTKSLDSAAEIKHDIDVLNHTLADIEKFTGKLNSSKNKKRGKSAIAEAEFIDCLQKIKYSFNLLGKVKQHMYQPSAADMIHMVMDILPMILSKCPGKNTARSVLSPFLTQKAITLLSSCVTEKERQLWESLGDSWLRTRADWPNGKMIPHFIPTFSDGWLPTGVISGNGQPEIPQDGQTPPNNQHFQPVHLKVIFDFEARNDRELSLKKGETVKVLDQSRQWWMVENAQQERGFVPNNILESTNNEQVSVPLSSLHPASNPQEVTAWLQEKSFSRITVKCLGVLSGQQLLDLSREDIKSVCPEEGGRVFTELRKIQESLGM